MKNCNAVKLTGTNSGLPRIPKKTPKKSASKAIYTHTLAKQLKRKAEKQKRQLLEQH